MEMQVFGNGTDKALVTVSTVDLRKVDVVLAALAGVECVELRAAGVTVRMWADNEPGDNARALLETLKVACERAAMLYDTRNVPADGIDVVEPLPDSDCSSVVGCGDCEKKYECNPESRSV